MSKAKVGFVSLGCPKNEVDCELMLARVANAGYEIVPEDTMADVMIVNTCAFIQSAKEEAIENILDLAWLKKNRSLKGIIVTGCLAERYFEDIQTSLPEVDSVLSLGDEVHICEAIEKVMRGETFFLHNKKPLYMEGDRVVTHDTFAYLRIAEGCDNRCAYCSIPSIRGDLRSRPMESIVEEAKTLSKLGVHEIILVAQDTTVYGRDLYGRLALPELLEKLATKELGFKRIRLLYCYPDKITPELCRVMKEHENICRYIDLPIQHASDDVLARMNRHGGCAAIRTAVSLLRDAMPEIAIRTTVMVGFPGESDKDFQELLDFVREMRFQHLGAFVYSREENTPAFSFPDQVPEDVAKQRMDAIMALQVSISEAYMKSYVGTTQNVVCEGYDPDLKLYFGRTAFLAPEIDGLVYFSSDRKVGVGEECLVKMQDSSEFDLFGKEVKE